MRQRETEMEEGREGEGDQGKINGQIQRYIAEQRVTIDKTWLVSNAAQKCSRESLICYLILLI